MIRLSANLSKKMPIPGMEFSSQQFGASMEIEVSDIDTPATLNARISELYRLLSHSIDEQLQQAPQPAQLPPPVQPQNRVAPSYNGGNGNGHGQSNGNRYGKRSYSGARASATPATAAQVRAITAICSNLGVNMSELLQAEFQVADPSQLNIRSASQVIDTLKARQNVA